MTFQGSPEDSFSIFPQGLPDSWIGVSGHITELVSFVTDSMGFISLWGS